MLKSYSTSIKKVLILQPDKKIYWFLKGLAHKQMNKHATSEIMYQFQGSPLSVLHLNITAIFLYHQPQKISRCFLYIADYAVPINQVD